MVAAEVAAVVDRFDRLRKPRVTPPKQPGGVLGSGTDRRPRVQGRSVVEPNVIACLSAGAAPVSARNRD